MPVNSMERQRRKIATCFMNFDDDDDDDLWVPFGQLDDLTSRIDLWHLRRGRVFLSDEINSFSVLHAEKQLLFLADLRSAGKSSFDRAILAINSEGGDVEAAYDLIDFIVSYPLPLDIVARGRVYSAAALVLASGKAKPGNRRLITPNCRLLIHEPWGGAVGKATEVEIGAREINYWRDRLADVLAQWTGQPRERLLKDMEKDRYMNADEAIAYGLADDTLTTL